MDIKEKMELCFNDELIENKILTENEKKVLASLMYSYMICKESKDNVIIRSMDALRKDIQISQNDMYDAIRNLESLYHMIERTAGESRGKEKSSIASKFKLNFDVINNPPKERMRFDFSKKIKPSETSINTVVIDTEIVTDIDTNIVKETNIDRDIKTVSDIDTKINNDIEIEKDNDVVFENEINNKSNNSIYNTLNNLDNYFINSNLQTYNAIQVKSQLNEMINSFEHVKDIKQLLPTLYKIFDYIKEHKDKFISWRVEELRDKIELIMNYRYKELS